MSALFPTTAEEFYRLRDDRTNQYLDTPSYALKTVHVTGDEFALETPSGQVLLLASCNLLSRWCRTVIIQAPEVELHPALGLGKGFLVATALEQMREADPFGRFEETGGSAVPTQLQLHIGTECVDGDTSTIVLSASGWHAAVCRLGQTGLMFDESPNCVGALYAAALGAARIFRDSVGMSGFLPNRFMFDGFFLRPILGGEAFVPVTFPHRPDVGSVLMVGAGSVGSAAAYCMRLLGIRCKLAIVDGDAVGIVNFNRSPTVGKQFFDWNKARALCTFFAGSPIVAEFHGTWWDDFADRTRDGFSEFDVWLPLANEFGIRQNMAHRVPPLMIQASTGRNWGVNFGRHIPGADQCLAERFAGFEPRAQFRCSDGEIVDASGKKADAALPFLSFFAGVLVAVDLVRLHVPGYPHVPSFAAFDFGGQELHPFLADRKPSANCFCKSGAQERIFRQYRSGGRYASLSPVIW